MYNNKYRSNRAQRPPTPAERLGQTTVWQNTDNRIERRVIDGVGMIYVMEIIYPATGPVRRDPQYRCVWQGTEAGWIKLMNLSNAIYDDIEDHNGANLPIEQSLYDERYRHGGSDGHAG